MDNKAKAKIGETAENILPNHSEILSRKLSITEIRAKTHESEKRVKERGPDLLTGEGMDSKLFLEKLYSEGRNQRPKWLKAWEHVPFTKGLNKKTLVAEIQTKSKERIERIYNFAKANPNIVRDIFGGDVDTLNKYLEDRQYNIARGAKIAIEASGQGDRRLAAESLAVDADRLQRLEWRLNHAGNLESKGKETEENIQKAYKRLETLSTVDYRAITVIMDAIYESERRTKHHLKNGKEVYERLYESWFKEVDILINAILKKDRSLQTYGEDGVKSKMRKFISQSKELLQNDIEKRLIDVDMPTTSESFYFQSPLKKSPPTDLLD